MKIEIIIDTGMMRKILLVKFFKFSYPLKLQENEKINSQDLLVKKQLLCKGNTVETW